MEEMKKERILISACLLGVCCRYDGEGKRHPRLEALADRYEWIPVCPEQLGGLPTPREPAERQGDFVWNRKGQDVTQAYLKGAGETLKLARLFGCKRAILKEKSPACGWGKIYDGSFSGTLVKGNGVTAERLAEAGIGVLGESEIDALM